MLIDDQKYFVELTIDAIMCGKVKYDIHYFVTADKSKELNDTMHKIARWIVERGDQNSEKFKKLTQELFVDFVSNRASQILLGELNDNGLEKENLELKTKNAILESENRLAVEQLAQIKGELEILQDVKPVDRGFNGFK